VSGDMPMKKCVLWLLVFLMLFNTGCIEKKVQDIQVNSKDNQYLTYNLGRLPEDLLLLNSKKTKDRDLLMALYEGLVKVDEFGSVVPGLAESWIVGKDNISYDFKIRENAKWSDGTDITAYDFVEFFISVLNPKLENIYAHQLYYIFGASEYRNNNKSSSGVAIKAVDKKSLQIRLNAPSNCFLQILSQPIYSLRKINNNLKNWQLNYENIVYSGAFKLEDISKDGKLTLVKNDNYYDKEETKSDKIFITSIENSESALASFKTSSINVFTNPPLSESKDMIINGEAEAVPINSGLTINFNLKKIGNISDANFRKALSFIVDRTEISGNYLNNLVRSSTVFIPDNDNKSNSAANQKLFKDIADYASAKKLVEEGNFDLKERLKLIYIFSHENKKLCESIAKDIKEALGESMDAVGLSEFEFKEALKKGEYHMAVMDYTLNYDDPMALLENWLSYSSENLFGYKNNDFDSLILQAKFEKDALKRNELLRSAEQLLANDLPTVPIYFYNIVICKKSFVKGVFATKEGNVNLSRAYIEY
jgi:peptide/nickel transport system substrate-binding protein